MSPRTVNVKMAEMNVVEWTAGESVILKTTLGSCVGLILSDPVRRVAGLAHIMLPLKPSRDSVIAKYADTAVPALVEELRTRGCQKPDMRVFVIGGACMFTMDERTGLAAIGDRNVEETLAALSALGMKASFQETGGTHGRTVLFDCTTQVPMIKMLQKIALAGRERP